MDSPMRSSVQFQTNVGTARSSPRRVSSPSHSLSAHPAVLPKRAKHATMPGSITAPRLHYNLAQQSIQNPDQLMTERQKAAKADVKLFKRPQKLGTRPEWEGSVQCPNNKFPDRPMMATIPVLQSMRPVFNYRAEVLPDTLKGSIFLPRPTKFQFDAAKLLNKSQRDKLVPTNPVGNSRVEFSVHPALDAARPWDNTTQITADSKKDYYAREGRDVLKCTKAKNKALLGTAYIGPAQREKVRNQRIRELKMSLREKPVETSPVPYTLSAMRKGLLAPLADYPTFITEPVVQPEATQESAAPLTPDPEASDTGVGEAQEAEQPTANSPSKRKAQVRVLV